MYKHVFFQILMLSLIPAALMADNGKALKISVSYKPDSPFYNWIDSELLTLYGDNKIPILQVNIARRGRFILVANQTAVTTPIIDWKANETRPLCIVIDSSGKAYIEIDGKTYTSLQTGIAVASLENITAIPTKSPCISITKIVQDSFTPAPQFSGNKDKRLNSLLELDKKIMQQIDIRPVSPHKYDNIMLGDLKKAVARVAMDSLWARFYAGKKDFFNQYLRELELLSQRLSCNKNEQFALPNNASGPWLGVKDNNLYFGGVGWSMGCYVPDFATMGLNLISTSIWPDKIYDKQGILTDKNIFLNVLPQLKLAGEYGIKADLLVAPYTPIWLMKKRPQWDGQIAGHGMPMDVIEKSLEWKGRTSGHGFLKASIIDAEYRKMCKEFIEYFLPYLKNFPALAAVCIGNEIQFEDYSSEFQHGFQKYLKEKYKTITVLNKAWNSNYKSFEKIVLNRTVGLDRSNIDRFWDWVNYNWQQGNDYISFLNKIVKQQLPNTPIHVKTLPYEFGMPWMKPNCKGRDFYDYADGVNRMSLVQMSDFAGTDSWGDNFEGEEDLSTNTVYQSMYFELLRYYKYKPTPIYDSEWHIINTNSPMPPRYVSAVMQIDVMHGLRAGALWVAHPLVDRADFLSSARLLEEIAMTATSMRQNQSIYISLANRERPIAILYSPYTKFFSGDKYIIALKRVFEVGLYLGIGIRMIDERQLCSEQTDDIKGLIVLGNFELQPGTIKAIKKFNTKTNKVLLLGKKAFNLEKAIQLDYSYNFKDLYSAFLKFADILSIQRSVIVKGIDNQFQPGVEWHCTKDTNGKYHVFVVNISRHPVVLDISGPGKLKALDDGREINGPVNLKIWETFIGTFE